MSRSLAVAGCFSALAGCSAHDDPVASQVDAAVHVADAAAAIEAGMDDTLAEAASSDEDADIELQRPPETMEEDN